MRLMMLQLLLMFFIAPAWSAQCDYVINLSNVTTQVSDINQVIEQSFSISRAKGSEINCGLYRLYYSKGLANSYQRKAYSSSNDTINYNLHSNINQNGVLKEFNDALASSEFISGTLPQKDTFYNNSFFISVPSLESQNSPLADIYTDNIKVDIYGYRDDLNRYTFDHTATFTVTIVLTKKINISIVDEGAPFDISSTAKVMDFGLLEQNAERGADIRTVSNTPYKLSLTSQNNGQLKMNNSTIAYQLRANGATINLSNSSNTPVQIATGTPTGPQGDLVNVKIKITGTTEDKLSGLYQDVITVTAVAN